MLLAENGRAKVALVTPADSPAVVWTAAKDLAFHLREMTGAEFAILMDDVDAPGASIYLGNVRQLAGRGIDSSGLQADAYRIVTMGDSLAILGGSARGIAYGVYDLLDKRLGCRWFTPAVSHIPHSSRLELPAIDETVIPKLIYREVFWYEAKDPLWNLRQRLNPGWIVRLDAAHGGAFYYHGVHTFQAFAPPERYAETHPDYFALVKGRRQAHDSQLCLTNPDVLELAVAWTLERFREDADARVVDVSQNDAFNPCECEACQAIALREESEAGPVIEFVNRVADTVRDEFPDRFVGTLAYQYTRKPPKSVAPRPNVVVRLCSIECCFYHPLDECESESNRAFVRDLKGWNAKTNNLFIWDYTTNFSHYVQPHLNLRALRSNIQVFIDNGVRGIFEQGCYNGTGGGELAELRSYLLARFLWDPTLDFDTEVNEFLAAYYGPSAGRVREMIDFMYDKAEREQIHIRTRDLPQSPYFRGDFTPRCLALLDEAAELVSGDPEFSARVEKLRLPILYVAMGNAPDRGRVEHGQYAVRRSQETQALIAEFFRLAERHRVELINEFKSMEAYRRQCTDATSYPVVRLANKDITVDIVPGIGGRIAAVRTPDGDRNWLYEADARDRLDVGYGEEIFGPGNQLGMFDAFTFAATTRAAILSSHLPCGLHVTRTIRIPEVGAGVTVETTLRNDTAAAMDVSLRVIARFFFGYATPVAFLTRREGVWHAEQISTREKRRFDLAGPSLPDGAWGYFDAEAERCAIVEFEAAKTALVQPFWGPTFQTLPVFYKPAPLAAGDAITFRQKLEFRIGVNSAEEI